MSLEVPPHSRFSVQASSDLLNWTVLSNFTLVAVSAPIEFEDLPGSPSERRFYRIGGCPCE